MSESPVSVRNRTIPATSPPGRVNTLESAVRGRHLRKMKPSLKTGDIVFETRGPEGPERHPMAVSSAGAAQSLAVVALNVAKQSQAANAQVVQSAVETARVIAETNQSASGSGSVDISV